MHLIDGMTGQDHAGFPGLPPPEELSKRIHKNVFKELFHISSLSSAHLPSAQNLWSQWRNTAEARSRRKSLTPQICKPQQSRRKRGKSGTKNDTTGGRRRGMNDQ